MTRKILCVGLVCLDIMNYVNEYPVEDSDNRSQEQIWSVGGNAANNCTVLSQLSTASACEFLGVFADDHTLTLCRDQLRENGIEIDRCPIRVQQKLPISCAVISLKTGSRTIVHSPNDLVELKFEEFRGICHDFSQYNWVHFEGRNFVEVRQMMDFVLKNRGEKIYPKLSVEIEKKYPNIESLIFGADFVFLSKEFAKSRGFSDMEAAVNGIAASGHSAPNATIICAWGELGAIARLPDGKLEKSSAFPPQKLVDTLGAGDSFVAGTISVLNSGKTVAEAIEFGCKLAGAKCGQKGLRKLNSLAF